MARWSNPRRVMIGCCAALAVLLGWSTLARSQDPAPQDADAGDAHALYQQARAALPDRAALQQLLDRALAADPDYSPAYALKAEQYAQTIAGAVARGETSAAVAELGRLAIVNAERAIALDPSLDGAYSALALTHRQFWRWREAEAAYRRAYELKPNDETVLFNYGWFLSFAGRHAEAIAMAERGVALRPTLANPHRNLGVAHAYAGNAADAATAMRDCIGLDARVTICHIYLAFALLRQGETDAAAAELAAAEKLFGANPTPATLSSVAHGYYRAGRGEDAARLFAQVREIAAGGGVVGAGSWPLGYLAIGDADEAYAWLTRAVEKTERGEPDEGFFNLMIIKANVAANPVLDEPRFRALRDRIGTL